MTKGQFKIQKVMDAGTSNPIVAALIFGMSDIVNMARIDEKAKELINKTNMEITQYLIKAEKIADAICTEIELEYEELKKNGVQTQAHERCVTVPSTKNIDDVRDFLKYGKKVLQELVEIFNLFLKTTLTLPRYDKLLKSVKTTYDEQDPIYLTLKQDHDNWLKHFLDLRSAEEHPKTMLPEGKSFYYDFDIKWSEENQKWEVGFPCFYEGTSIYELLKASMHNLFTFVEHINILFLQKQMPPIVEIRKVPEDKIKDYNGKRFVIELKGGLPPSKTKKDR